jgi:hypothetical protein
MTPKTMTERPVNKKQQHYFAFSILLDCIAHIYATYIPFQMQKKNRKSAHPSVKALELPRFIQK